MSAPHHGGERGPAAVSVLELRQARKVFPAQGGQGDVVALDGVDLTLRAGEFLALVGASGSGKSTLLDLAAGFTRPTGGQALLRDGQGRERPVEAPGPDRVVVFQDHAVFPWYTALGNVAYGLRRQGMGRGEARARALEALDHMGMADFAAAYPAALSGGMRQRVALARVLVLRPSILLLDEPFASLDVRTRNRLQDQLTELWRRCGWAVIFVSHMLDEAVYLADRVVALGRSSEPTASGSRVLKELRVALPRPRQRDDPRLAAMARSLSMVL